MDITVKEIANHINNRHIVKAPVVVKKYKVPGILISYVVIGCTPSQSQELKDTKEMPKALLTTLKSENLLKNNIHLDAIVFTGVLENFNKYDNLVGSFPHRRQDVKEGKPQHFRDYTKTREQQIATLNSVLYYTNAERSWESVIIKVGSTTGIVCRIKEPIDLIPTTNGRTI